MLRYLTDASHFTSETSWPSNSLTWSRDPATSHPLVCVSGGDPRIKVLDAITGALVATCVGHGKNVNDLLTHPKTPRFIASASEDHTIRLWDLFPDAGGSASAPKPASELNPTTATRPCALLCAGDGHRAGVLTIVRVSTVPVLFPPWLFCRTTLTCRGS